MSEPPRYDETYVQGMEWLNDLERCDGFNPCGACPRCTRIESLGIVGHEAAKFTEAKEVEARKAIRDLIEQYQPARVVSGECPLGGVDIWAREIAVAHGVPFDPKAPRQHSWDGEYGFKARNLDIAKSTLVVCIVVHDLPPTYRGRRFDGCYHCKGRNPPHVKSGGCWTAWRAARREWIIL